ncbi:MAG: sll0787 family AIR synthase-like protein [Burkholderiales bacterium]|nr:sll0787 family AIR synthase-like protein [Burkholderiales bacterium]
MLHALAEALRSSRGIAHKRDIDAVMRALAPAFGADGRTPAVAIGDDCAAIPDGEGWMLFAMEGFQNGFVAADPWFAGWCALMVNISDVAAMGGRPLAVTDAVWSNGDDEARVILEGMAAAARTFGVPVVGGHSNSRSDRPQLAAAILGRARRLLTSFDARPGDVLLAAIDLRGRYREPFPHWDAATGVDGARLRGDLELLPGIAEDGLAMAAKDISMAGVIGTALMLFECSGVGGIIDVHRVPAPTGVEPSRWLLSTFPSFGYLIAAPAESVDAIVARFIARDIACAAIGRCDDSGVACISDGHDTIPVWDFAESPLIGCGPATIDATAP